MCQKLLNKEVSYWSYWIWQIIIKIAGQSFIFFVPFTLFFNVTNCHSCPHNASEKVPLIKVDLVSLTYLKPATSENLTGGLMGLSGKVTAI